MDSRHQESSEASDMGFMNTYHSSTYDFDHPNGHCIFCRQICPLESETYEGFDDIFICEDCKLTVLGELDLSVPGRASNQRRLHRILGSENLRSVEDMFSEQLLQMINLLRRNNGSIARRWVQALFHDVFDLFDGENDDWSIAFGTYQSNSGTSLVGENSYPDDETITGSNTYGDLNEQSSDDEEEEWEDGDIGNGEGIVEGEPEARMQENHAFGLDDYVGTLSNYLDAGGFEELLERLAMDNDNSRRGAPPAAATFIENLPLIHVCNGQSTDGGLQCAICKEYLHQEGDLANQLPCLHLYHPKCILPWLSIRNSCPVCRFELPTDDRGYEEGKRRTIVVRNNIHETSQQVSTSTSRDGDPLAIIESDTVNRAGAVESARAGSLDEQPAQVGWISYVAMPIVGIVGAVLVAWLQSSSHMNAPQALLRINDARDLTNITRTTQGDVDCEFRFERGRRWWSLF